MRICPNCGEVIKDGADVCDNCGALSNELQDLLAELSGKDDKNKESNTKSADTSAKDKTKESTDDTKTKDESPSNNNVGANPKNNIKGKTSNPKVDEKETDSNKKTSNVASKYDSFTIPVEELDYSVQPNPIKKVFVGLALIVLLAGCFGGGYAYYSHNKDVKVAKEQKEKEDKLQKEKLAKKKAEDKKKKEKEQEDKEKELLKKAEEAKKDAEKSKNQNSSVIAENPNDTPNADGTYNDEPEHLYEEDVAPGDARLYWVSDRTLTDAQAQAVANKFGASWTIMYIYAKHGYIVDGYTKYGFVGETSDKAKVEAKFNGAERRNVRKLANY